MRMSVVIFVLTLVSFNLPTSAHAKIAINRATIVSVGVIEDGNKGVLFGSIVVETGSLLDKKKDRISAKITRNTSLSGGRGGKVFKFSDLKPGMAIIINLTGRRGGLDEVWEVSSIQVITLDELLRP